jgi:hypothetical protein
MGKGTGPVLLQVPIAACPYAPDKGKRTRTVYNRKER